MSWLLRCHLLFCRSSCTTENSEDCDNREKLSGINTHHSLHKSQLYTSFCSTIDKQFHNLSVTFERSNTQSTAAVFHFCINIGPIGDKTFGRRQITFLGCFDQLFIHSKSADGCFSFLRKGVLIEFVLGNRR